MGILLAHLRRFLPPPYSRWEPLGNHIRSSRKLELTRLLLLPIGFGWKQETHHPIQISLVALVLQEHVLVARDCRGRFDSSFRLILSQ